MRVRNVVAATAIGLAAIAASPTPAEAATPPSPNCPTDAPTIRGSGFIVGTPGRDVIWGSSGPDVIDARGGWDIVCGGDGADAILGGGRLGLAPGRRWSRHHRRGVRRRLDRR